jgi:hypothetical protein
VGGELTHTQRQVQQPDGSVETREVGAQPEARSRFRAPTTAQDARSVLADAMPVLAGKIRNPAVQSLLSLTREALNNVIASPARQSETLPVTTNNMEILRRSVLSSSEVISEKLARPVSMRRDVAEKEISDGVLPLHVGNTMRIFRQYLDMPHVRLHNDASANFMAAKLNAEAFTMGRDLFFASGKLNLSTPRGIALLGHELTHVKQQEQQNAALNIGEMETPRYEALENEALANEQTILSFLSVGSLREPPLPQTSQIDAPMITRKHVIEPFTSFNGKLHEGIEDSGDGPIELTHIQRPTQTQYMMPQKISTPLMAEEGRDIETATSAATPAPTTPEPTTTPNVDINGIAEKVYDIIERRLRSEKERRGYF